MPRMEQMKWTLLVGLWVVWATILAARWLTYQEPARMPLKFASGQRSAKADGPTIAGMPVLVKRPLSQPRALALPSPKNIFAPLPEPLTPRNSGKVVHQVAKASPLPAPAPVVYTPPPPPPLLPPPSSEEIAAQQARQQQELAAQQVRQLMTQFRYLGYLTQLGEPQAFLGKGNDLYIVRVGDTVEGRLIVTAVEATSLTLRDLASQVERTVALPKDGSSP